MSKVIKLRLGARQVRTLWWLLQGTFDSSEDSVVRSTCQRVMKQLGYQPAPETPPVPLPRLVPSTWCTCGHEHCRVTATGLPTEECAWAFCPCARFSVRPAPDDEERARMRRQLDVDLRTKPRLKA
jgi:hypothetical protein